MSLAVLADNLASKGRNGDTMLVHMTPGEVHGLHALALAHGGELTINPETGLPEANFLKKLLPTIIGAGISYFSGGTIDPMTAAALVGGFETVRTGDLSKGISAGLGAYGGASLSAGFSASAAGSEAALAAGQAAVTPEALAQITGPELVGNAAAENIARRQLMEDATREYLSKLSPTEKLSAGFEGLTSKGSAGRDAFMKEIGGVKGLSRAGLGILAGSSLAADKNIMRSGPQTVTQPPVYHGATFDPVSGTYIYQTPFRGANGGLMGMANGGVAFESGMTPSYQRASMSPGMLDFVQRSEPVVRMATGGFTDERVAQALRESMGQGFTLEQSLSGAANKFGISQDQLIRAQALLNPDPTQQALPTAAQYVAQQSILNDPQAAALAAARSGIAEGMTNEQIADMVNMQYGKTFNEQNVADFMTANQLTRPDPAPYLAPDPAPYLAPDPAPYLAPDPAPDPAPAAVYVQPTTITSTDPTQQALPTAAQYAAQQSILNDPQAAALAAVRGGITAGMTDQQIADMVNMQYGKTFNAQNVADFMTANQLTRPAPSPPPPPPVDDATDVTYGGDTVIPPYVPPQPLVTLDTAFQPPAKTMNEVKTAYEQGGGSTRMPTITNIQPTDRTYTYNQAFDLLQGYLLANPYAMYGDVVAFARNRGIPEMQARAAYNEFRFSGLTGGSKQAYDYLMGRAAYSPKPFTPTGEVMRPYAESVLGAPVNLATKRYIYDEKQQKYVDNPAFVPRKSSAQREKEAGINPDGTSSGGSSSGGSSSGGSGSDRVQWSNEATGEFVDSTRDDPKYKDNPSWKIVQTYARGGLMDVAAVAAARGGQFDLGGYSDGGRLLRGPGDGVSDSIPATIGNKRPARLADGEFVVPARIVSEIGNGSTEAGARKLYAMMDRVQRARAKTTGKGKVAKNTRAEKYLPA